MYFNSKPCCQIQRRYRYQVQHPTCCQATLTPWKSQDIRMPPRVGSPEVVGPPLIFDFSCVLWSYFFPCMCWMTELSTLTVLAHSLGAQSQTPSRSKTSLGHRPARALSFATRLPIRETCHVDVIGIYTISIQKLDQLINSYCGVLVISDPHAFSYCMYHTIPACIQRRYK